MANWDLNQCLGVGLLVIFLIWALAGGLREGFFWPSCAPMCPPYRQCMDNCALAHSGPTYNTVDCCDSLCSGKLMEGFETPTQSLGALGAAKGAQWMDSNILKLLNKHNYSQFGPHSQGGGNLVEGIIGLQKGRECDSCATIIGGDGQHMACGCNSKDIGVVVKPSLFT